MPDDEPFTRHLSVETPPTTADLGTISASSVSFNTATHVIVATDDKLRIILRHYEDELRDRNAWSVPLGVFLTIFVSIVTADFHDAILPAAIWKTVFYIAWLGSVDIQAMQTIEPTRLMNDANRSASFSYRVAMRR